MITYSKKFVNISAVFLLLFMLAVAILSLKSDSLTMDEQAHIPAGYGYMHERDYRLNPEHPPLLKDLSAIPLLFMNLKFDKEFSAWKNDVNDQWDMGKNFIFYSGNNPDKIIFWARMPMLLILIIFGIFIFRWAKELFGPKIGLLALFLFSFSPTFIAHGRYVTTDVGAAAAFFIATYYFIKWLQQPTKKNLIISGVVFGVAQLTKFSLIILIPYFGILLLIKIYIEWRENRMFFKTLIKYCLKFALIVIIGYLIVYPVYWFNTLNYPFEKQVSDTQSIASHFPLKLARNLVISMSEKPILRPYAQYLLGLFMVFQRTTGGNTTFFLGEINNIAWKNYFPIVYAIKEPLALHILTIIAILFLAWQIPKNFWRKLKESFVPFLKNHFTEIAVLIFVAIYWFLSITSNLNIGVRHILPTYPFVYLLISGQIKKVAEYIKNKKTFSIICCVLFAICLMWYAFSSLSIFPYYLTHFNELIGGTKNGHLYVADSNLDWGQDLKRLAKWVDENNIQKIKIDYFGGDDPLYRFGNKFEPWHGEWNPERFKRKLAGCFRYFSGWRTGPYRSRI